MAAAAMTAIRATQITANSAKSLVQMLDQQPEPTTVEIETAVITRDGAYGVAKAFGSHPKLGHLSISTSDYLGRLGFNVGATLLCARSLPDIIKRNPALHTVSLRLPFLCNRMALQLKDALQCSESVEAVELRPKFMLKGALQVCGEILQECPHLHSFRLETNETNTMIGEEGMTFASALCNNTSLAELVLHTKAMPSRVALQLSESLRSNTAMRILDLNHCSLKEHVLVDLARMLGTNTSLETLRLQGNELSLPTLDALATVLESNLGLRTLDITGSRMDDELAQRFAAALRTNPALTSLNASDSEMADPGAFAIADMLHTNTHLVDLDLSSNLISDPGVEAIAKAAANLTALAIGSGFISDVGLTSLARSLLHPPAGALRELRTGGVDTEDKGLVELAEGLRQNTTLEVLVVRNRCAYLPSGKRQWVEHEPPIGARVRDPVEAERTHMEEDEYDKVSSMLHEERTRLSWLRCHDRERRVRQGPFFSSPLLEKLQYRQELMEVDKTANTRRSNTLRAIPKVDFSLKTFMDTGPMALAEAMKENNTLRHLELSNYQISSKCARALGEMLAHNSALQSLALEDNYISSEGAWALARELRRNSSLTHLSLRHNILLDEGAVAVAEGLKHNTTLQTLDLRNNYIGDDGAHALFATMGRGIVQWSVDLRENCVLTTILQSSFVGHLLAESRVQLDQD
eukprot:GGOE01002615.1.p1 GENE.GGOE01002615.1~~GGOE01002615.1.p1  ORF type:complete len:754 (-),score=249.26 GGOE01002615.1:282-2360(-)